MNQYSYSTYMNDIDVFLAAPPDLPVYMLSICITELILVIITIIIGIILIISLISSYKDLYSKNK